MKLLLTSTIEYVAEIESVQEYMKSPKNIVFLPLGMPSEMSNTDEWNTFYGQHGQLREIYEHIFKEQNHNLQWINIYTETECEIHHSLTTADIIVIVGGDACMLTERIEMLNIIPLLTAFQHMIIGVSAGAKIWFEQLFVEHEDASGQIHLEVASGIGYFKSKQVVANHVQFTNDQLIRLYTLLKQETIDEIIAIGDAGAVLYDTTEEVLQCFGAVKIFQ